MRHGPDVRKFSAPMFHCVVRNAIQSRWVVLASRGPAQCSPDRDRSDIPAIADQVTANKAPPPHSWFVESGAWAEAVQAYLACIRWTDEQVGRLIDALDKSPHSKNTIVVLFSDHGFHLGEKDRWTKFSLWERSTRVPFLIVAPEMPSGNRCDRPAELLGIYPTLLELCGLPTNPANEGRSLVPLLKDSKSEWSHYAITTHGKNNHAVRSDRYRYIRYRDGSEELYDMKRDPNEWDNLAWGERGQRYRDVIRDLRAALPAVNQ